MIASTIPCCKTSLHTLNQRWCMECISRQPPGSPRLLNAGVYLGVRRLEKMDENQEKQFQNAKGSLLSEQIASNQRITTTTKYSSFHYKVAASSSRNLQL
jgi:hypothetical protein